MVFDNGQLHVLTDATDKCSTDVMPQKENSLAFDPTYPTHRTVLSRKDSDVIPNSQSALCTALVIGLPTPEHEAATATVWANANLFFGPRLNTRS